MGDPYPDLEELFQFLSRNSVRWDARVRNGAMPSDWFQFLSRNSVRWDAVKSPG